MRYLAILGAILAMNAGCGIRTYVVDDDDTTGDDDATGDDDTADDDTTDPGDDDDSADPLAPVVSEFAISHGASGDVCFIDIAWHAEDADGDLTQPTVFVSFDGAVRQWNVQVGAEPPILSHDFDLEIQASTPGQLPLNTGEIYPVELWMTDDTGRESNRIGDGAWASPDGDCQ